MVNRLLTRFLLKPFFKNKEPIDLRDLRDAEKLYDRIKTIQNNNEGMTFLEAADIANQMYDERVEVAAQNGNGGH